MTMGYYTREELPFYWALADQFTLVRRLPRLDPRPDPPEPADGQHRHDRPGRHARRAGRPTPTPPPTSLWNCTWTTMQEVLEDKGVSWKVYTPSNVGVSGKYAALSAVPDLEPGASTTRPPTPSDPGADRQRAAVLQARSGTRARRCIKKAFKPTFPNDFAADVKSGTLPSVSWIIPPLGFDEHPSASPINGQWFVSLVLDAADLQPEGVVQDRAVPHVRRERRLVRSRRSADRRRTGTPGEYLTAKQLPGRRARAGHARHHGPARPRRARAAARGLAVQPRRSRRHRGVRPHLAAEAGLRALRRRGAERLGMAAQDGRRPHLDAVSRPRPTPRCRGSRRRRSCSPTSAPASFNQQ